MNDSISNNIIPPERPSDPISPEELAEMLKKLKLSTANRCLDAVCNEAELTNLSYRTFLGILCAEELAARKQKRIAKLVDKACFPEIVTIDDIDFTYQTSIRRRQLGDYLSSVLVTEGKCAIFLGSSGNAKTGLAIAMAYEAIQQGYTARFTPVHALISTLARAAHQDQDRFEEALAQYVEPDVLVIDEMGYLTLPEQDAANVLYRVVDDRHKLKKSMLVTTNKALAAWGQVLHDGDMAGAIIDRILARGRLFELTGLSYRTKHIPPDKLGIDPQFASSHGSAHGPATTSMGSGSNDEDVEAA